MHGFDEFIGSLYHLNAEEEPELRDYPRDMKLPSGKTFLETFGPRGVIKSISDGKGGQTIENLGVLTKKRMETIDEETLAAAKDFITRMHKEGKPFFCWWNGTRMHFRTHVKEEHIGISGQDEYGDGMVEHDMHVGELLKLIDDLGIADNTIVQYSTDNGPHYNTGPTPAPLPFMVRKTRTGKAPSASLVSSSGPANSQPESPSTASSLTKTGCPPSPLSPVLRTSRKSSSRAAWNSTAALTKTTWMAITCSITSAVKRTNPRAMSLSI